MVMGKCSEVETHVLKAVSFSPSLTDPKVEIDKNDASKLMVSFNLASGETLSKVVSTARMANDWLLSCSESAKSGSLSSGLRKVQNEAKPKVEVEKQADKILEKGGSAPSASGPEIALSSAPAFKGADVTAEFLATASEAIVELPSSTVCVHKGSLKTFSTMAYAHHGISAALFGKKAWNQKFHVTNFVLVPSTAERSIEEVLSNQRLVKHCQASSLELCGMAVSGDMDYWTNDENQLKALKGFEFSIPPILLAVDFSKKIAGETFAWERNMETGNMQPVSISYVSQPHDLNKRLLYNVCWLEDIGIDHIESATMKICSALLSSVLEREKATLPNSGARKIYFEKVAVPRDGLCGWYALVAAQDPEAWCKIARNEGAYATNPHIQRKEQAIAQKLHQDVCQRALTVCSPSYHSAIKAVMDNPSFSPADLQWISFTCSTAIRCTCDPKARAMVDKYIYIYKCNYIYICDYYIYI